MQANMLKGKLTENGMTQANAAERIGISLSRFNAKLNSWSVTRLYHIFFVNQVKNGLTSHPPWCKNISNFKSYQRR